MSDLTWQQVHAFRLQRHYLARPAPSGDLLDVASSTCGLQAQVMSAAQLALRARTSAVSAQEIEQALWQDHTLVKVWSMRGTLHLLPARELPLYVAALKPYRLKQERRWLAQYGVDDRALAAMADAILEALRAGPLTRRQLTQALQSRLKHSAPQIQDLVEHGWGGLGKYVCLQGDLCVGPNQGQEATFVRRDHWLAEWEDVPGEQAEAWLLRRYLGAYGPAIVQDFAAWAGLSMRDARQIWQRLRPEMATTSVEGKSAAVLESDLATIKAATLESQIVHLLPSFDVYLLGHRSKSHLVADGNYKRVYRAAGWISPVILIDGRVAGVWSYTRREKTLQVNVEPFATISKHQRALIECRATNFAHFFNSTCELAYTGTLAANPAH